MARRHAYAVLASIVLASQAFTFDVVVQGTDIYTLHYLWGGNGDLVALDTTSSDSVYEVWTDSTFQVSNSQIELVSFHLPTTVAACDCFYVAVTAVDLTYDPWHGRTGIGMPLFPRDSTDTSVFNYVPNNYWGRYYTLDSLEYGDTCIHRTYMGLDAYFQFTLNRDFPACREIVMGIEPATVGDTHFVVSAALHWFTQALTVGHESRGQTPVEQVTVFPNPFVDSFMYNGPRARYRIFNVLGQEVSSGFVERLSRISLQAVPNGTYFFQIDSHTQTPVMTIRKVE